MSVPGTFIYDTLGQAWAAYVALVRERFDANYGGDPATDWVLSVQNVGGLLSIEATGIAGGPGSGQHDFCALECTYGVPISAYNFAKETGANSTFSCTVGIDFATVDGWMRVLFTDFLSTIIAAATDATAVTSIEKQQITVGGGVERTLTAILFESDPGPATIQFQWQILKQGVIPGIGTQTGGSPDIASPGIMITVNSGVGGLIPTLEDISDKDIQLSMNYGAAAFSTFGNVMVP
jgi:hypothetical protein